MPGFIGLLPFRSTRTSRFDTVSVPSTPCVHQLFEQQVLRTPVAPAVKYAGHVVTYLDLNRRANQIARYLRSRGVGTESLVGVCFERQPDLVATLLAVWKAGAAYVPIDPAYPPDRLAYVVDDARVEVLMGDEASLERVPERVRDRAVVVEHERAAISLQSSNDLNLPVVPDHLAYVIYTSGSTGAPKGAMITHRGLENYLRWAIEAYGVGSGGSVPVHSSIGFDLTVTSLYPALLSGSAVELVPTDPTAEALLTVLRSKGHTLIKITPAHLDLIGRRLSATEAAGMTRAFVIGGETLPAEALSFWRMVAPNTRLFNEYGPTETVVGCAIYEVTTADPYFGPVPIGKAIANMQLYVVDRHLRQVPAGVTGELVIGGVGVARGYLNRPELTAEKFIDDRFSGVPGARLYRSGDLARRRKDGVLEFLGRADGQVKIRGFRVELGEIEAALSAHPAVSSCAVLAREDTPGEKQLVAYVVQREAELVTADRFKQFLRQRLPEFMVPVLVLRLDEFPLTPHGKIDRRLLPSPAEFVKPLADITPAKSPSEALVLRAFRDVLNQPDLGADVNFFDAGGHSLSAAHLLSAIREASGFDLPLRSLFEHPTAAALASVLESMAFAASAQAIAAQDSASGWEQIEL